LVSKFHWEDVKLHTHVGGRTDARYHVGRREGGLLNVLEVIVWLFVVSALAISLLNILGFVHSRSASGVRQSSMGTCRAAR
jgi:hypothetical protein